MLAKNSPLPAELKFRENTACEGCLWNIKFTFVNIFFQGQVKNKKRFFEEYREEEESDISKDNKTEDFKQMFAGNIDDCFRIGISASKKSLELYAKFYSSDIIVASPLGLRTIIGNEG